MAYEGETMEIGVIGVGAIGGTIARKLSANGHSVRVANSRGPGAVKDFAGEIGAAAVDVYGAVKGADVLILSIPFPAVEKLPADLFDAASSDLVIIDTGNYYPDMRDPRIAEIDAGIPESVWVSKQIGRPVIKAYNNILAPSLAELGQPEGSPGRLAVAVAGDDTRAKQITMQLVNETGFDPVDGGTLDQSWRQQPSTPSYCCDYDAETMREALAAAVKGEAEKIRDNWKEIFGKLPANPTHADMIALNRSVNTPPSKS
ncbi:NAD(P)-binding domain-containing protein [Pelagibacterium sp. H642]|uniref:NADPH-dependent F420 reductase n=1 Tax=Pelagibacterium sp. H642 TaxID=1881069 RepID=UPI002814E691|nr:NAD(P)-binding domain-containing protein [Pelagibacterium sp. H642]WMT92410.1 NAD(P)-binding domain-containing protein [Pelagibacterium sp. H642]